MDERPITGHGGERRRDAEPGSDAVETGRSNGRDAGLTTVEEWTPPSLEKNAAAAVSQYLTGDESLRHVDAVTHVDGATEAAAVGLTDDRLLLVTEDGAFHGVGHDRICSVRSDARSSLGVRGNDYRLLLALGYLLAVIGFLGVLGTSVNPFTPTLALVTLGGVLVSDYVLREGADLDAAIAAIRRHDGDIGLADRVDRLKTRLNRHAADDDIAFGTAGAVTAGAFVLVAAAEGAVIPPLFVLLVVAGAGLAVYAFRHSESFDGIDLVRRRQRTVTATLEDGSAILLRTRPDSRLDRELSGLVQAARRGTRVDDSE